MKLISFLLNVIVGPLGMIALVYYFYVQDVQQAILISLLVTTLFTGLRFLFSIFKMIFSAVTFNFVAVLKTSGGILMSLAILGFYWLAYYYVYGADFALNI